MFKKLFQRWFGSSSSAPTPEPIASSPRPRPKPKVLGGLEEGSPVVMVDTGNGVATMMDRMAYEYTYGDRQAPDPTQASLDSILARTNRVRVLDSGMMRDRAIGSLVVVEETDPAAILALRGCLGILEEPSTFSHCMCLGGPTLELYADKELLATIAMHHGAAIRWYVWKHDAALRRGDGLVNWLVKRGLERELAKGENPGMFGMPREEHHTVERLSQRIAKNPRNGHAYARRGELHLNQGNPAPALADCTKAIALGLEEAWVFQVRSVANDHLGQRQAALADCERAVALDPNFPAAFNSRGLIQLRLGRVEHALADFSRAIELAPEWPLPYCNQANAHAAAGDFDGVIADFTRVIHILEAHAAKEREAAAKKKEVPPPQEPTPTLTVSNLQQTARLSLAEAHRCRAEAHLRKEDREQAEADYDAAIDHDPAYPLAYRDRGHYRLATGDFTAAFEDFQKVIRLCPEAADGYFGRALCQAQQQQLEEALPDFNAAIQRAPDRPEYLAARGRLHLVRRSLEEAEADFSRALELAPREAMLYGQRGDVYQQMEQLDRAIADYSRALDLEPDHLTGYVARAGLLLRADRVAEAITDLNEAIQRHPEMAPAYYYRADAFRRQKRYELAIEDLTELLRLDAGAAFAHVARGQLHHLQGDYAQALADFTQALGLQPDDMAANNQMAWLLATCPDQEFRHGEQAVEYAGRACQRTGWELAATLDTLAAAHAECGQFDEAIRRQQQAIDLAEEGTHPEYPVRLALYEAKKPYREE